MINAVLVFNNTGQPRLTKFYTQIVCTACIRSILNTPTPPSSLLLLQLTKAHAYVQVPISTDILVQDTQTKQSLIGQIYDLVSQRKASACNFLPLPPLLSQGANASAGTPSDAPTQVVYRTYATLSFVLISTSTESPLALIDLIQVFVEALDRLFDNVCELDLIFGFETMHAALGEMIVGGIVVETSLERIVQGVRLQEGSKPKKKSTSESMGINLSIPWR